MVDHLVDHFGGDVLSALSVRCRAGSQFDRYSARSVLFIGKFFKTGLRTQLDQMFSLCVLFLETERADFDQLGTETNF